MDEKYKTLLTSSFDAYLELLNQEDFPPGCSYLSYDFDFLRDRAWHLLGKEMVARDLRELTNLLNRWLYSLKRWHVWNQIISQHDEDTAWALRGEFLDAFARECLLKPSALRDILTSVATSALHEARLSSDLAYRDHLEGDPTSPTDKPRPLTRGRKEARLRTIANKWPEGEALLEAICRMDSDAHKDATSDYRNLSSHTLGPRLGLGTTRTVTRTVEQATKLEKGSDGFFRQVLIPGKMCVSYGFGGTLPLDLDAVLVENERQLNFARDCCEKHLTVLKIAVAEIRYIREERE